MSRIDRFWILATVLQTAGAAQLGARLDTAGANIAFRVHSSAATRIEVWIYNQPLGAQERLHVPLSADPVTKIWAVTIPVSTLRSGGVTGAVYHRWRGTGVSQTVSRVSCRSRARAHPIRDAPGQSAPRP